MPPDVIDLLDSDDELPSLSARLLKREPTLARGAAQPEAACQPPASVPIAAERPPLSVSAVQNHSSPRAAQQLTSELDGLMAGAEALRRRQEARAARKAAKEKEAATAAAAAVAAAAPLPPGGAAPARAQRGAASQDTAPASWQREADYDFSRPQYHQQEQWQSQGAGPGLAGSPGGRAAAAAATATKRQPRRGATAAGTSRRQLVEQPAPWQGPSQPWSGNSQQQQEPWGRPWGQPSQQQHQQQWEEEGDGRDEEWVPGGSQLAAPSGGQRQAAGGRGSGRAGGGDRAGRGGGDEDEGEPAPAAKKPRRPKRTQEEIERDKELQAQQRADKKRLRQAGSKNYALQQVRLLVDTSLMSGGGSGGGGGGKCQSLGVDLLYHINKHNSQVADASAEKRIQYATRPLDMAPYKALRWERRRLEDGGAGGGGGGAELAPASQQLPGMGMGSMGQLPAVQCSQLEERWELEPHVMLCLQPQEFIDAVQRDRLASVLSLLEARAPGQHAYIMVQGLDIYIKTQEGRQYRQELGAGAAPASLSVKSLIEGFVSDLAIQCPRLGFRDVVDSAQAAQHVRLITEAIAQQPFKDSDATVFLRAHDKSDAQAVTNLLINHPLEDRSLEPFMRSIAAVPTVKPGIAHSLSTVYQSLGGLMQMLLDPQKTDSEKVKQIENMPRVGHKRVTRVGPAAARQLLQLLTSSDPDLRIKEEAGAD